MQKEKFILLRQQNKGTDTGGYRAKELPAILSQMP